MRLASIGTVALAGGIVVIASGAIGAKTDFLAEGVDNGRTGWVRDEKVFTTANVGSTKLLWKVKLESKPRAMHNLFAPLVAERVATAQGTRELAVVAGVSDDMFGIDVATGREIWHRRFDSTLANPGGTNDTLCPGGQTAVPTMAQTSPGKYTIYAVSWDGRLRQVNLADGQDVAPPEKFIPGGGKPYALNLYERRHLHRDGAGLRRPHQRVLLVRPRLASCQRLHPRRRRLVGTARRGHRSRRPSVPRHGRRAFRSADPPSRQRHRRGEARRQQAAAAGRLLRRAERELALAPRSRRQHHAGRLRSPQARKFLVGTSKECRLWLLDRDALGGEDHRTTLHTTPLICNDAQAFDAQGHLGRARRLAGRQGHAVGDRAVLGTGEQELQGADRALRGRRAAAWPHSRCSSAASAGS